MPPGILPVPPRRGRALPPILVRSLILFILEATQGRQRFLEISSMVYGHRVGTNKIRTYPPIATVYIEFFFCSMVCVILVRQFVHLENHFFSATQFDHGLSESCITDETIVNAQEFSLLAFLQELIRDAGNLHNGFRNHNCGFSTSCSKCRYNRHFHDLFTWLNLYPKHLFRNCLHLRLTVWTQSPRIIILALMCATNPFQTC